MTVAHKKHHYFLSVDNDDWHEPVASDLSTIAASGTANHASEFTSNSLDVSDYDSCGLTAYATGANASSSGDVTFYIAGSTDGTNFEDAGNAATFTLALNGTATVRVNSRLNIDHLQKIRLVRIVNGDTSYAVSNINVEVWRRKDL